MNHNTTRASKVNIWWPMYPADFAADTGHLSNEEIGIYIKILNYLWRNQCNFPCDIKRSAKLVGISPKKLSTALENLDPLIIVVDGKLYCDWLSKEYAKATAIRAERSKSGKKGGEAKARNVANAKQTPSKSLANGVAKGVAKRSPSPSPSPSPFIPVVGSSKKDKAGGNL